MALWLCRTSRHGEHEGKFLEDYRIFLTCGGLSKLKEPEVLLPVLEELYPKLSPEHRDQNSGHIWVFKHRMAKGDWVDVPSKRKKSYIGETADDYAIVGDGPKAEAPL